VLIQLHNDEPYDIFIETQESLDLGDHGARAFQIDEEKQATGFFLDLVRKTLEAHVVKADDVAFVLTDRVLQAGSNLFPFIFPYVGIQDEHNLVKIHEILLVDS
jgi:hypothetical protein